MRTSFRLFIFSLIPIASVFAVLTRAGTSLPSPSAPDVDQGAAMTGSFEELYLPVQARHMSHISASYRGGALLAQGLPDGSRFVSWWDRPGPFGGAEGMFFARITSADELGWVRNNPAWWLHVPHFFQPAPAGGYLMAGGWDSDGGLPVEPVDLWVVRMDSTGAVLWEKTLGGLGLDEIRFALQTDAGILIGATSSSGMSGNKTAPNRGGKDIWVIHLSDAGTEEWQVSLGGSGDDMAVAAWAEPAGGFLIAGTSASDASGNKTAAARGATDYWLVSLAADGAKQWDRAYGGSGAETLTGLEALDDGSFVLTGNSASPASGDKTAPAYGGNDFWIAVIDDEGAILSDHAFGGASDESLGRVYPRDDGLLLTGSSQSGASGNKTTAEPGHWIVQLTPAFEADWQFSGEGLLGLPLASGSYFIVDRPDQVSWPSHETLTVVSSDGTFASRIRYPTPQRFAYEFSLIGQESSIGLVISGWYQFDGTYWVERDYARRMAPPGTPAVLVRELYAPDDAHPFEDTADVAMVSSFEDGQIFYTLDGSTPTVASTRYTAPFNVSQPVTVRALAVSSDLSTLAEASPVKIGDPSTPLQLANPRLNAEGFDCEIRSPAGLAVEVQFSTNLQDWQTIETVTNPSGTMPFQHAHAAPAPYRFYRLKPPAQ